MRKNKKWPLKGMIFSIFLAVFSLGIIVSLLMTNWKINQRRSDLAKRLDSLKAEVGDLEKKNDELKKNISYVESQDYVEQVAREQLDMKKPGEEVVVIQKESNSEEDAGQTEEKMSWWEIIKSLWTK